MATIDYKELYEQALAKAQELSFDGFLDAIAVTDIFPELAESEDERIRKVLLNFLEDELEKHGNEEWDWGFHTTDVIAWLEKQSKNSPVLSNSSNTGKVEQKPDDKIEPKFRVGQTIIYKGTENIAPTKMTISDIANGQYWDDNCCIAPISDQDNWELVEQKPTGWSEEDEKQLQHAMLALQWYAGGTDIINWLKSLRPQSHWKPSDEQIRELGIVATGKGWFSKEILSGLLEQLKKLKG